MPHKSITAPRGKKLTAKSWLTEAPLRLLMNNLDTEVAEDPENLIVYGGRGKAARNWECYDKIIEILTVLENNETLLVQSGKPVGVFPTHVDAPRVLIANSNIVAHWADWDHFNALDQQGLMMYGQMTAGSWIYIGSQGIIQGTYETFVSMAQQHYQGNLAGKWILTAGLGGMGGAQPLAATMAGASCLVVECDPERIKKRMELGYLDHQVNDLDQALKLIQQACENKVPVSVGLLGNAAEIIPDILERGIKPDAVTDQTSAHDPLNGYLPKGWSMQQANQLRKTAPEQVIHAARQSIAMHVKALLGFHQLGIPVFDYGNNIRQVAYDEGIREAFSIPGFVVKYIRPQFCKGVGPFRWVALSGAAEDIYRTDALVKELIPDNPHLHQWLDMAQQKIPFQGLPSRICWLGLGEREKIGLAFNELVKNGECQAPIAIGRDHLDSGSVASPNRETEAMLDGSDAIADWPLLNGMLNAVSGATWVSMHHGGGVGIGYSQHSGFVIVADGSDSAAARLHRVLHNDPATGVMRHADAGYADAINCATTHNLNLPLIRSKS